MRASEYGRKAGFILRDFLVFAGMWDGVFFVVGCGMGNSHAKRDETSYWWDGGIHSLLTTGCRMILPFSGGMAG